MATATLRPDGDSATYDGAWTLVGGTAGLAYTTIDETPEDDADYITSTDTSSPYDKQAVTLSAMPEAATSVSSVILKYRARCASSTTSLVAFLRSSGADQEASGQTISSTVAEYSWDITSLVAWTTDLLNALEVGWRRNSGAANAVRVTQAWVEVTYVGGATSIAGAETGTLTDIDTIAATGSLSDAATLTETDTIVAVGSLSDTGALTDTDTIAAAINSTVNSVILRPNGDAVNVGVWYSDGLPAFSTLWEGLADEADTSRDSQANPDVGLFTVSLSDIPTVGVVQSVIVTYRLRSPGTVTFTPVATIGGSDSEGSPITLTTSFADYTWDITSLATWTTTLVNGLLIGGHRTNGSGTGTVILCRLDVVVTYADGPSDAAILTDAPGTIRDVTVKFPRGVYPAAIGYSASAENISGLRGCYHIWIYSTTDSGDQDNPSVRVTFQEWTDADDITEHPTTGDIIATYCANVESDATVIFPLSLRPIKTISIDLLADTELEVHYFTLAYGEEP